MSAPLARSSDEAHLYMELHPCRCGESDLGTTSSVAEVNGEWVVRYAGTCVDCGLPRVFEFRQPDRLVAPDDGAWAAGTRPSELLDAGEWLFVADTYGSISTDTTGLSPQRRATVRADLSAAAAAVDEVLKFLPPDEEWVPHHAFWSPRGREVRDAEPGRFRRARLEAARDAYRESLWELG